MCLATTFPLRRQARSAMSSFALLLELRKTAMINAWLLMRDHPYAPFSFVFYEFGVVIAMAIIRFLVS
jgi:hypothetical protein